MLRLLLLFSNSLRTSRPLLFGGGASSTSNVEMLFTMSFSFCGFFAAFETTAGFFPAEEELELAVYFFLLKLEPFA